ncbi:response regulator transcription factor [Staphylococcus equorum]|uniref:response regulator transcription factor n=1 Tax=Staphylococcus equorum TaxID=246432 RepID=UPI0018665C73|nr:response regulator transcription factor [Staphylococcus equorum]
MNNKILIIEDDKDIQKLIRLSLEQKKINNIFTADDIHSAELLLKNHKFSIILLDLNLNNENGYKLLKFLDLEYTKLLIVSAMDSGIDVYEGFKNGAVDYIKKPFDPIELSYRVSAHISENNIHYNKHLKVNFKTEDVYVNDVLVKLTTKEFEMLIYFIKNQNQVLSKEQIYRKVWDYSFSIDYNSLMVHIRTLRKKIEINNNKPDIIETIRGRGYIYRVI